MDLRSGIGDQPRSSAPRLRFTGWRDVFLVTLLLLSSPLNAATQVVVVVGQGAPDLEHVAAQEVVSQFKRLFDAQVMLTDFMPERHEHLVLVGGPQKNRAVRDTLGDQWPELSEQGFILRSFDAGGRKGVVVGGNTPAATLWAVSELGHRFGIRYLLHEDIYPETQPLRLSGFDVLMEPNLKTRGWRAIDDLPTGTSSWSVADHRQLWRQLAKLKFNHALLATQPWQPFESYECGGVKKRTGVLWRGERFPLAADSPGRAAFGEATELVNVDLSPELSSDQMAAAGVRYLRGVISQARRLGFSVGISISPLEFPPEFTAVVPELAKPTAEALVVSPGAAMRLDDPALRQLIRVRLRSCLETYPQLDVVYLTMPDLPAASSLAESAWQSLWGGDNADGPRLADLINNAAQRSLPPAGDAGALALRSDLVSLACLRPLLEDPQLRQKPDGGTVQFVLTDIDPALAPWLSRLLPEGVGVVAPGSRSPGQILQDAEAWERWPAKETPLLLDLDLGKERFNLLPSAEPASVGSLVAKLGPAGWRGFIVRPTLLAGLDSTAHYLSRTAWDHAIEPRAAHDDLFVTITGKQDAADLVWQAQSRIDPRPEDWGELSAAYGHASDDLERARNASHPRGQALLDAYTKRTELARAYVAAIEALRQAARAPAAVDATASAAQLQTASESLRSAIDAFAQTARDPSDRAFIAVLNKHAYEPLVKEHQRLIEAR